MATVALSNRIQNACLMILAVLGVGFVLYWFRGILIPFVLAVFFAYALGPIVELQNRYLKIPRALAVLATLVVGALLLAIVGGIVSTSVQQLAANSAAYQDQLEQLLDEVAASPLLQRVAPDVVEDLDLRSILPTDRLQSVIMRGTSALANLVSNGLIVLIFLFFLLAGEAQVRRQGFRADVETSIRRYILVQTTISAATGSLVAAVLTFLGVPLATVFGLLAFLLNFIPSVGSIIATLLPLPVVLVSPEVSTTSATLAIAVPAAIQFAIGNVIAPKIMGDSLQLHPVTILLALMVWGSLWGIVGMLLATPITAVMRMLLERLEMTRPIARVMSGSFDLPGQTEASAEA